MPFLPVLTLPALLTFASDNLMVGAKSPASLFIDLALSTRGDFIYLHRDVDARFTGVNNIF